MGDDPRICRGSPFPHCGLRYSHNASRDALSSPLWGGVGGGGGAEGTSTLDPAPPPPLAPPHKGEGKRVCFSNPWRSTEKCESASSAGEGGPRTLTDCPHPHP
ncbi:hypothetical protein CIW48_04630 [Methylobacterium sp. P1-11]|nr:hypothetical protein CIW48_04630 [Methylobacterium sp. P1-11]